MAKPVILTVDDEPVVSAAVDRELRSRYGRTHRIVSSTSPREALETLRKLRARNDDVALLLVDQRMPELEGTEFLLEALSIYPDARRVLLTAYADTSAAITAINEIGLDHYLMKPWAPAEENLFPVLDDLLRVWESTVERAYDGIEVAGTAWSPASHVVKDFLARSQVPYKWLDLDRDVNARERVTALGEDRSRPSLPVVFLPNGRALQAPSLSELADHIGQHITVGGEFYDVIIIGAGPAGLAAAVYAASEGLRTLLVEKGATGGQAGTSSRIENYLGFPGGVAGADLARRATVQAKRLGAEILTTQEVSQIRTDGPCRGVHLANGRPVSAHALVIATGVTVRTLDVPGIEDLVGAGVYYGAANSEAANLRGEHAFVVGGANSAGQAAMYLSRFAAKVTMLVRGDSLAAGMSQYLVDQIEETPTIEVRLGVEVTGVHGEGRLRSLDLRERASGTAENVPAAALFVFIGARPHTDFVDAVVARNAAGFLLTGPDLARADPDRHGWPVKRSPFLLETSAPGVFAVGDVRDGVVRRVAAAVGQGSTVISMVHEYLKTV